MNLNITYYLSNECRDFMYKLLEVNNKVVNDEEFCNVVVKHIMEPLVVSVTLLLLRRCTDAKIINSTQSTHLCLLFILRVFFFC